MAEDLLNAFGPELMLVAMGYAFARLGVLGAKTQLAFNQLAMWALVPATILSLLISIHFQDVFNTSLWGTYFGAVGACLVLLTVVLRVVFGVLSAEVALLSIGGVFSNLVLIGLPVIEGSFGPNGLSILMTIISIHSIVLLTSAILWTEWARNESFGWIAACKTLVKIAKKPFMVALMLGVALSSLGVSLPEPIFATLKQLRGALAPIALMLIGASCHGASLLGDLKVSLLLAATKALALPACVYAMGVWIFGLSPFETAVLTMIAALPVGANPVLIAREYNTGARRLSSAALLSLWLGFVVMPVLLIVLPRS